MSHTLLFDGDVVSGSLGPVNAVLKSEWPEIEGDAEGGRIVLVVDTSGSMADQRKLEVAIEAVKLIHELLPAGYEFELVTYGTTANVWARPGEKILSNVFDLIRTNGSTNLEAGLQTALNLNCEIKTTLPTTFIVMTDGDINLGRAQTPQSLATLVKLYPEAVEGQWRLIGIGDDYSETFIKAFSELLPNCVFRHCTEELMADVIGEVVGMAFQTAARHIQVQIEPSANVAHKSVGDPLLVNGLSSDQKGCYLLPAAAGGSTTYCTFSFEGSEALEGKGFVTAHVVYHGPDGVVETELKNVPVVQSVEADVDEVTENILRLRVLAVTRALPSGEQGIKILDELIAELRASRVAAKIQKLIDLCDSLKKNAANAKERYGVYENLRTQSGGLYCTPTIATTSAAFGLRCSAGDLNSSHKVIDKEKATILKEEIRAKKAAGAPPSEVIPLIDKLNEIDPPSPTESKGFFASLFG